MSAGSGDHPKESTRTRLFCLGAPKLNDTASKFKRTLIHLARHLKTDRAKEQSHGQATHRRRQESLAHEYQPGDLRRRHTAPHLSDIVFVSSEFQRNSWSPGEAVHAVVIDSLGVHESTDGGSQWTTTLCSTDL